MSEYLMALLVFVLGAAGVAAIFYFLEASTSQDQQAGGNGGDGAASAGSSTDAAQSSGADTGFNPFFENPSVNTAPVTEDTSFNPMLENPSATPEITPSPWSRGIARAEGFYLAGSLPQRSHNPGDLTKSFGFNVTGVANKEGVLIFASDADGWSALEAQKQLIANGQSRYTLDMSVQQFAETWTLGRAPINDAERAGVNGWIRAFLQEVGQGLTASSSLGEDTQSWSA